MGAHAVMIIVWRMSGINRHVIVMIISIPNLPVGCVDNNHDTEEERGAHLECEHAVLGQMREGATQAGRIGNVKKPCTPGI